MTMKPQGDAGQIAAMAGRWRTAAGRLQSLAPAAPAGWSGSAHDAFTGTWGSLKAQSANAASAMQSAAGGLDALGGSLSAAQAQWAAAGQLAASNGLVLHDDGTVTGSGAKSGPNPQQIAQTVARQAEAASWAWTGAQDRAAGEFAALSASAVTAIHGTLEAFHVAVGMVTGLQRLLEPVSVDLEKATEEARNAYDAAIGAFRMSVNELTKAVAAGDAALVRAQGAWVKSTSEELATATAELEAAHAAEAAAGGVGFVRALSKFETMGLSALDAAALAANVGVNHFVDHQGWPEAVVTSVAGTVAAIAGAVAGSEGGPVGSAAGAGLANAAAQEAVKWIWEHPHQAWQDIVNAAESVTPYGVAQNLLHGVENWAASLGSVFG
jgi:hypothetical protein